MRVSERVRVRVRVRERDRERDRDRERVRETSRESERENPRVITRTSVLTNRRALGPWQPRCIVGLTCHDLQRIVGEDTVPQQQQLVGGQVA